MRVRVGPVSVSSRGRVGVRAGPVSVYGGGRRRRSSGSSGAGAGRLGLVIAACIVLIVVMWPLSLFGHAIGLTPSWHQLMHRNHVWEHQHYPLVGLRYLGAAAILLGLLGALTYPLQVRARHRAVERNQLAAAQAAESNRLAAERAAEEAGRVKEAHAAWLAAPPPPLMFPGRFTQSWIAHNAADLHPGQIPILMDELRRRGWTDSDIEQRVEPYLPRLASRAEA